MKYLKKIWPVFILLIQNIIIFLDHYTGEASFTWDFVTGYYPLAAFSTSMLQNGVFPQWMPFQQMGYPFAFSVQSGIYYPPIWIFPLFHIPYTIDAANIFQAVHFLAGAVGVFLLLNLFFKNKLFAFSGAFCFQFFGGLYSNSQHVDIIRAFVLLPYLFYVFTLVTPDLEIEKPGTRYIRLPKRLLFIPIVLYLFETGAYPGNLISAVFIIGIYVLLQLIQIYVETENRLLIVRFTAVVGALSLLGIALAAVYLVPPFLFRSEMVRYNSLNTHIYEHVWFSQFPGLFLSSKFLPGEISMSSTYVTLPAFIIAFFAQRRFIKQYWIWMVLGLISLMMALGPLSFFWKTLTKILPILNYSRMASSDYRIFLVFPILILFIGGIQAIISDKLKFENMAIRTVAASIIVIQGVYMVYFPGSYEQYQKINEFGVVPRFINWLNTSNRNLLVIEVFLVFIFVVATCYLFWRRRQAVSSLVAILIVLISIDAYRVLPDMNTWSDPVAQKDIFGNYQFLEQNELVTTRIPENINVPRDPRETQDSYWLSLIGGYIDGRFLATDKVPCYILACEKALNDPLYNQYMQFGWRPIILDQPLVNTGSEELYLDKSNIQKFLQENPKQSIMQVDYNINKITYDVSLDSPKLFIENEIYFPGWTAEVSMGNTTTKIEAVQVNDVFRGWLLPAGKYTMITRFVFPYYYTFLAISLTAFLIWCLIILLAYNPHLFVFFRTRLTGQRLITISHDPFRP